MVEMVGKALAPHPSCVTPTARFGVVEPDRLDVRLGAVPQAVVYGFDVAWSSGDVCDTHERLELLSPELRGFGYEGATMACGLLDALAGRRSSRVADLAVGPGSRHFLLSYIGLGFAMARTPRAVWPRMQPSSIDHPHHPHMSWLAVDGYGFDLAYFNPRRYVEQQRRPAPYTWHGGAESHFNRTVDQGMGRALWFMCPQARSVAQLIATFAPERRADLWSGVGLAATFVGPSVGTLGLEDHAAAHGHHVALAVGACFALQGRLEAEHVPDRTTRCFTAVTGLEPGQGGALVHEALRSTSHRSVADRYEAIREYLGDHFDGTLSSR